MYDMGTVQFKVKYCTFLKTRNKSVSLLTMFVFQVALLKKYPCSKCGLNMEITTDQASVPCTSCGTEVIRKDQASSDNSDSVETK